MKREKLIFPTGEIAHKWFHKTDQSAKAYNPHRNFYFEGDAIYSYGDHFPIAVKQRKKGVLTGVIFFTDRTYSRVTSKHISRVRGSIPAHARERVVYCLNPDEAARGNHGSNLKRFENRAKEQAEKLAKATKPYLYTGAISVIRADFEKYCQAVGLKPKSVIKREKFKYLLITAKPEYLEMKARDIEKEKAREKKRQKELQKAWEDQVIAWRSFERDSISIINGDIAILRYNKETKRVETSKGIELPIALAKKLFTWFTETLTGGGCTSCNKKILDFDVESVDASGLKVGCHFVSTDEINDLAASLGWK